MFWETVSNGQSSNVEAKLHLQRRIIFPNFFVSVVIFFISNCFMYAM